MAQPAPMRLLIVTIAILFLAGGPACAQLALPGAAPAKPPAPPASELTPAETQSVLQLLNDPARRAAFAAQLQALSKAAAATAPKAASPVKLAPDSVGAEVIRKSATWLADLDSQVSALDHVLGNLPAVWSFSQRVWNDPGRRARAIQTAWHLGLIVLVAALVEWLFDRILRRPIAALARLAPAGTRAETDIPAGSPLEDGAVLARHHRFTRTLRVLKRLPFVLLRLVLELLSPALFLILVYAGMVFAELYTQAELWVAVTAYMAVRITTALTRVLVSPDHASLRMVHLNDHEAAYALAWVRWLAAVAGFGYAATQIGMQYGLPPTARDAFLKAVALIDHIFLVVIILQIRGRVAARIRSHAATLTVMGRIRGRLASVWHLIAIFFVVALWLVWAAQVRNGYARLWHVFLVTVGVLIAARLIAIVLLGGLERALRVSPDMALRYPGLEARANRYYPLLRGLVINLLFLATAVALLWAWGVNTASWFAHGGLGGKLASALITVAIAGAVTLAIWEGVNTGLDRHLARLSREAQVSRGARLRTLMPILRTMLMLVLVTVFGLTALSEIGVNIAPLLAGAGIIGVAIGFGSQKLVQDFITGIFLLLENAMQVGDAVTVAGLSGSVENLSIRTMRLRAGDGSVHIIPFSSVSTVTNVNRGIGNAAVSVVVPIEEDSDHVSSVLADIVRGMRAEPSLTESMRSDFQLWGVDRVDAGNVTIVGQIVCTDTGRWAVQREFNRRMNIRFKELGIRIGTPVSTTRMVETAERAPQRPGLSREDKPPPPNQIRESPPPSALGHTS